MSNLTHQIKSSAYTLLLVSLRLTGWSHGSTSFFLVCQSPFGAGLEQLLANIALWISIQQHFSFGAVWSDRKSPSITVPTK
uniref:Putative secreted protein n=1 Tax=Rhipicephalus microplus TaxID=6941 RepID=A0A6G5A0N7_RHIMP